MNTPFELFHKETPKGWDSIVDPLIAKANELNIEITQVKEKFGGLRFYHNGHDNEEFDKMVRQAKVDSEHTCNVCGEAGKVLGGWWLLPFCEEHAKMAGRKWE